MIQSIRILYSFIYMVGGTRGTLIVGPRGSLVGGSWLSLVGGSLLTLIGGPWLPLTPVMVSVSWKYYRICSGCIYEICASTCHRYISLRSSTLQGSFTLSCQMTVYTLRVPGIRGRRRRSHITQHLTTGAWWRWWRGYTRVRR